MRAYFLYFNPVKKVTGSCLFNCKNDPFGLFS